MKIYKNWIRRIEEDFLTLKQEAIEDLKSTNLEYSLLLDEIEFMVHNNAFLKDYSEGKLSTSLTSTEQQILMKYLNRLRWKELHEKRHLYFLGHQDALSYIKKTGVF